MENENEIICPYCSFEYKNSVELWTYDDQQGFLKCENCGKTFFYKVNILVTYSTYKFKNK